MSWRSRPMPVLIVALLYLTVGSVGFVYHFQDFSAPDGLWIELTEFLAFISGLFLLFGQNWARWLAVAWIAFHVALSFGSVRQTAVHALFLAVIAWLLFRPDSTRFFRRGNA